MVINSILNLNVIIGSDIYMLKINTDEEIDEFLDDCTNMMILFDNEVMPSLEELTNKIQTVKKLRKKHKIDQRLSDIMLRHFNEVNDKLEQMKFSKEA